MHIYSNFRRRRTDHLTKKRSPQLASSSLLCSKPSSVFLTFVQIWLDLTCRSRRRMTQSLARLNWVWVTPHQPASFDWPPAVIARIRINFCFQTAINERFFLDPPSCTLVPCKPFLYLDNGKHQRLWWPVGGASASARRGYQIIIITH